jgi:uncharacterized protein YbjT (DUF2867 family)
MKIGITGANGAVGRHLLTQYGSGGDYSFIAAVRSRGAAEVLPRSPAIAPAIVTFNDPKAVAACFQGCSAIIHLAGILFEMHGSTYETANIGATRAIVDAAEHLGNPHLIFVSALGADSKSRNRYLSSKGVCEDLIARSNGSATIIRTPLLLGPGTAGGQTLLRDARRRRVWLLGGGKHTTRPLDVDDLSRAMLGVCGRLSQGKSVHDLVGSEPVRYRDLLYRVAKASGNHVTISTMPVGVAKFAASITRMLKGHGLTNDVIDIITSSESVERNADRELAIDLTPLDTTIQKLVSASE